MPRHDADAADAAPNEIVRLLRALARPGATIELTGGGTMIVAAFGKVATVPLAVSSAARTAGWIVIDNPGNVRLTRAGREHLRRTRTRGGAPLVAQAPPKQAPREDAATPAIDLNESPLAWLARRQRGSGEALISPAQLNAGERFRADFWFAGLSPRVTSSWSPNPSGSRSRKSGARCPAEQTDAMLAARQRVQRALQAVGPELSGILIDVCGHLKGLELAERQARWPKRSAKVVLDLALTALARHYGLIVEAGGKAVPHKVRQWGTPGYRPPADAPGPEPDGAA